MCVLFNVYVTPCEYLQARHDYYRVGHALLSMFICISDITCVRHALLSMRIVMYVDMCVNVSCYGPGISPGGARSLPC